MKSTWYSIVNPCASGILWQKDSHLCCKLQLVLNYQFQNTLQNTSTPEQLSWIVSYLCFGVEAEIALAYTTSTVYLELSTFRVTKEKTVAEASTPEH